MQELNAEELGFRTSKLAEEKLRVDDWDVKIVDRPKRNSNGRNRVKITIKLDNDESAALSGFVNAYVPETVSQADFFKMAFITGLNVFEQRIKHDVAQELQKIKDNKEEYEAKGVKFTPEGEIIPESLEALRTLNGDSVEVIDLSEKS